MGGVAISAPLTIPSLAKLNAFPIGATVDASRANSPAARGIDFPSSTSA